MNEDSNPEEFGDEGLGDFLDEAFRAASNDSALGPASESMMDWLEARTGQRSEISLQPPKDDDPSRLLKPLGDDGPRSAGKYVVHGELGRGGVGTVHRGHDRDLGRDVAMKFLHERYRENDSILHRFVEEAQIGGQLQHPGIVPVYDLGVTDGNPYFAMKLIKGQTLAKKLTDRQNPTTDLGTFLGAFESVCQTMAYAHTRGVVHRDLKPANIMIGGFGEVQVVDWGMGKVLTQGGVADEERAVEKQKKDSVIETLRSAGHGTQSVMGSVMGTPAYMPPEQARGDVEAMDERSDVFALGAILCEILTGQPPYLGTTEELIVMAAAAKLDGARERLRESGAEPPLIELAEQCLSPAPAARPASADAVAKRIHAHLSAAETRAREASLDAAEAKGRAASLRRSQRLGIALTTAIAAGLLASLWFWKEASDNGRRAEQEASRAERELDRAVAIKTLLSEMLASVSPRISFGLDKTLLRIILESTSDRLDSGEIEDELVVAELRTLIGRVEATTGRPDRAQKHLEAASEIRTRRLGPEDPRTLETDKALVIAYIEARDWEAAEPLGRDTLERHRRILGDTDRETLGSMSNLAAVLPEVGKRAEAEELLRGMLKVARTALGDEDPYVLITMGALVGQLTSQARLAEADEMLREALRIGRTHYGEDDPETLRLLYQEGRLRQAEGRPAEAVMVFDAALPTMVRMIGADATLTVDTKLHSAVAKLSLGRNREAEAESRSVLETRLQLLGPGHPLTQYAASIRAEALGNGGQPRGAMEQYHQVVEWSRESRGAGHPSTIKALSRASEFWSEEADFRQAITWLEEAFAESRATRGTRDPDTLTAAEQLANACASVGDDARAYELYRVLLEVREQTLPEDHRFRLGTMTNLGMTAFELGRLEESAEWLEKSLAKKRTVLGLDDPFTRNALFSLARTYEALGRLEEERALWQESLDHDLRPAASPDATAEQLDDAARLLLTIGFQDLRDPVRAARLAQRAVDRVAPQRRWMFLLTLALAQFRSGEIDKAVKTQREALEQMPRDVRASTRSSMQERLDKFEAAARNGR